MIDWRLLQKLNPPPLPHMLTLFCQYNTLDVLRVQLNERPTRSIRMSLLRFVEWVERAEGECGAWDEAADALFAATAETELEAIPRLHSYRPFFHLFFALVAFDLL